MSKEIPKIIELLYDDRLVNEVDMDCPSFEPNPSTIRFFDIQSHGLQIARLAALQRRQGATEGPSDPARQSALIYKEIDAYLRSGLWYVRRIRDLVPAAVGRRLQARFDRCDGTGKFHVPVVATGLSIE